MKSKLAMMKKLKMLLKIVVVIVKRCVPSQGHGEGRSERVPGRKERRLGARPNWGSCQIGEITTTSFLSISKCGILFVFSFNFLVVVVFFLFFIHKSSSFTLLR